MTWVIKKPADVFENPGWTEWMDKFDGMKLSYDPRKRCPTDEFICIMGCGDWLFHKSWIHEVPKLNRRILKGL